MKRFSDILVISLALFLFSCGNEPSKEETKTADTTAAATAEPAVAKPAFTPFKVVIIQHKVKDFEKSKAGYFNSDSIREVYGITHFAMGRLLKDSNTIFVVDKIEDVEKSKAFFTSPKVKEAMMKAGVSRAPGYSYAEIIRLQEPSSEYPYRLAVTHHVKDFDTWLKGYDAEGIDVRAANGLIDRGMARDLNDSNIVSLLFLVSDTAKARARMASPELKKIMKDAGVDGPPTIRWYREIK
jgi:hypothetical protein